METQSGDFGISVEEARRIALDDQLSAHPSNRIVVIGCGNILRGDDAVGPTLIRHLWEGGLPDTVTIVDGGTAGMDVAFKMRGASKVIIIDAAATGQEPGTIYRVPGAELEDLPPVDGLHTHNFRWDHALSFGRWLLADQYPEDITVFLIEVADTTHGADLSQPVADAMRKVIPMVRAEFEIEPEPASADGSVVVSFTSSGYLRLDAATAAQFFPNDSLVAVPRGDELWLMPLIGPEGGGLLLKQRNLAGDRTTLVWEAFAEDPPVGERPAFWDHDNGALRVAVGASDGR